MDFFEQLGKRISDAGQNVAKKTKDFADTTQLNSAVSDKEKKINTLLLDLGKAYYADHKDKPSIKYEEIVKQINDLYAKIEEDKEKIKQIKGTVKCPKCGTELPLDAAFCTSCGTKIEQAKKEEPAKKICPKCGATVKEGNSFCNECGTKID